VDREALLPPQIRALPAFEGPFDAFRLGAEGCDVLFATYPAGTVIPAHSHETDNVGVITTGQLTLEVGGVERRYGPGAWYQVARGVEHSARFDVDTVEIELWFDAG
jgi:quercetin dioxygenase-like cupin family protein